MSIILKQTNIGGKMNYLEILNRIHACKNPETYLEIGIAQGNTLRLAKRNAIGIDPDLYQYKLNLPNTKIFNMTSDNFFKDVENTKNLHIDMAFIDGMHLFEFSLRDFINCEKFCEKDSIICFHDTIPLNENTCKRNDDGTKNLCRIREYWNGDVFKISNILGKYRKDLKIDNFTSRDGLLVVTNLDKNSSVLKDSYDDIVAEFIDMKFEHRDKSFDREFTNEIFS